MCWWAFVPGASPRAFKGRAFSPWLPRTNRHSAADYFHFHVAARGRLIAELADRAAKIGAALDISKTGVKNPHRLAVKRGKLVPEQPLVLPDGLQEAFRR